MEYRKPEAVEHSIESSRAEAIKAEANLRSLERAKQSSTDLPEKAQKVEGLQPNSVYEKNGYTYQTDDLARTARVSGNLRLEKGVRSQEIQDEVRALGVKGDQGGHIIAAQFDGPPDAFNIFPQDSAFNSGKWSESAWANMEREWAEHLKAGKRVDISAELRYPDNGRRPDELHVKYDVSDGKSREFIFRNQDREQIRYFSGSG